MRHFLPLALAPGVLTRGMEPGPAARALVSGPGAAKRLTAPLRRALPGAVDVAVVAAPADPHLLATPLAVEQPKVVLEHCDPPWTNAWESRHKGRWSGPFGAPQSRKARGGFWLKIVPGPSLFQGAE